MKKLLAMILAALFLMTSCGKTTALAEGYETARPSWTYSNLNLNGMFFTDTYDGPNFMSQRLWFFDFDSMQSAIMCARPNCKHDDPDVCTSYGMAEHPTVVGDKLYFFERDFVWDDHETGHEFTNVWRAELNGGSRLKIDTIDGIDIVDMVIKGSVAYFTAKEEITKMDYEMGWQGSMDPSKYNICSYDFEKEKFTDYGVFVEGFHGSAMIMGEYNGGLYIRGAYADNRDDYDDWNYYYTRFDLETGAISDWDMPISSLNQYGNTKPMFAGGGFYGYMDGDNTVIVDSEGNEMVLEGYELSDLANETPINGYLFNVDDGTAIDLSGGEILKLNMDVIPKWNFVLCYHNGSYILYTQFANGNFKKVAEDEIFKE